MNVDLEGNAIVLKYLLEDVPMCATGVHPCKGDEMTIWSLLRRPAHS